MVEVGDSRQHWMDFARGGAVIAVVSLHATLLLDPYHVPNPLRWADDALGAFRIPLLMFLSGLLLPRALSKPPRTYLSGKVRTLLWPLVGWGMLTGLIVSPELAISPWWWIHGSTSHTWFLAVLFLAYIVALVLRRVPPAVIWAVLLLISVVIGEPDASVEGFASRAAWFASFFFAGAVASRHLEGIMTLSAWIVALGLVVTAMSAGMSVLAGDAATHSLIAAGTSLIGILSALWVLSRLPRPALVRWVEWVGRSSIVTYAVHWPWMLAVVAILGRPQGWAGWALLFTSAILLCVAATAVRRWTPWLYVAPHLIRTDDRNADSGLAAPRV